MRNFGECVLVFFLFFFAAMAVLEVDRSCRQATNYGGDITASAQIIVEKAGNLG